MNTDLSIPKVHNIIVQKLYMNTEFRVHVLLTVNKV